MMLKLETTTLRFNRCEGPHRWSTTYSKQMANGDRKSNREGNGAENVQPIGIGCPEHGQDEYE